MAIGIENLDNGGAERMPLKDTLSGLGYQMKSTRGKDNSMDLVIKDGGDRMISIDNLYRTVDALDEEGYGIGEIREQIGKVVGKLDGMLINGIATTSNHNVQITNETLPFEKVNDGYLIGPMAIEEIAFEVVKGEPKRLKFGGLHPSHNTNMIGNLSKNIDRMLEEEKERLKGDGDADLKADVEEVLEVSLDEDPKPDIRVPVRTIVRSRLMDIAWNNTRPGSVEG